MCPVGSPEVAGSQVVGPEVEGASTSAILCTVQIVLHDDIVTGIISYMFPKK